jgi:hypothetical protein
MQITQNSNSLERSMMKEALRAVKDNQYDFEAWTRLLKIVEKVVRTIN